MATAPTPEKIGKANEIRTITTLLALTLMMALTAGPALSSGQEGSEATEHRGTGKSESKFYGTVKKVPADRLGTWIVNNREIMVTKETRIKEEYGSAAEGAYVEVEGNNTGKTFTAYKIEVKRAKK